MLRLISPHLLTCEGLYWASITRPPASHWCYEIYWHAMHCYWSETTTLPSQVAPVAALMHSRAVQLQQPYFTHLLMFKQHKLVLTGSQPRLTTTRRMPRSPPLVLRPGSSNILEK